MIAGKIVSVEARHASVIRDLLMPKSAAEGFARDDVINDQGLDVSRTPAEVQAAADPFIVTYASYNGFDFMEEFNKSGFNERSVIAVLTTSENPKDIGCLEEQGIKYILKE